MAVDGEAEKLTRVAVDVALAGDTVALHLCLDRVAPFRKDRPVTFALPTIDGLPPEKWSSLRYGFGPCGGRIDVEEAAHG